GTLGMIHFFNLYHVYVYYQHDLRWNAFYKWFEKSNLPGTGLETVQVLSLLMVVGLPFLIAVAYRISNRAQPAGVTWECPTVSRSGPVLSPLRSRKSK